VQARRETAKLAANAMTGADHAPEPVNAGDQYRRLSMQRENDSTERRPEADLEWVGFLFGMQIIHTLMLRWSDQELPRRTSRI